MNRPIAPLGWAFAIMVTAKDVAGLIGTHTRSTRAVDLYGCIR